MRALHLCAEPGCHELVRGGSRCPAHALPEKPRGSRQERGYTAEWYRIKAEALRTQPWCSRCGTAGSPDNPLTADHIVPLHRGGTSTADNCGVLCRSCNSSKRDR